MFMCNVNSYACMCVVYAFVCMYACCKSTHNVCVYFHRAAAAWVHLVKTVYLLSLFDIIAAEDVRVLKRPIVVVMLLCVSVFMCVCMCVCVGASVRVCMCVWLCLCFVYVCAFMYAVMYRLQAASSECAGVCVTIPYWNVQLAADCREIWIDAREYSMYIHIPCRRITGCFFIYWIHAYVRVCVDSVCVCVCVYCSVHVYACVCYSPHSHCVLFYTRTQGRSCNKSLMEP